MYLYFFFQHHVSTFPRGRAPAVLNMIHTEPISKIVNAKTFISSRQAMLAAHLPGLTGKVVLADLIMFKFTYDEISRHSTTSSACGRPL
jgi:hypothetical protein